MERLGSRWRLPIRERIANVPDPDTPFFKISAPETPSAPGASTDDSPAGKKVPRLVFVHTSEKGAWVIAPAATGRREAAPVKVVTLGSVDADATDDFDDDLTEQLAALEVDVATDAMLARHELKQVLTAVRAGRAITAGEGWSGPGPYLHDLAEQVDTARAFPPTAWWRPEE